MSTSGNSKKPQKKDIDIIEEDDDDNRSIWLLILGIILVAGLIVGVITFLNSDKENDGNDVNEPREVDVVDDKEDDKDKDKEDEEETEEELTEANQTESTATIVQTSNTPTVTKYTVEYYDQNGQLVYTMSVNAGSSITGASLSLAPNQEVYWYYYDSYGDLYWFDFSTDTVGSNLKLYAYVETLYTVRFMIDGQEVASETKEILDGWYAYLNAEDGMVKKDESTGKTQLPVWYSDKDYKTEVDIYNTPITADTVFYGKYEDACKVEYYFDPSDDYNAYGDTYYEYVKCGGNAYEITDLTYDDDNGATMYLKNWKVVGADGKLGAVFDFENDTVDADTKIAAVYGYKLKYDLNGGTGDIEPVILEKDENLVEPSTTPTKEKYAFKEWTTDSEGTTAVDFSSDTISGHTTIFAQWLPAVTFETNGGSEVAAVIPNATGVIDPSDIPANPTKKGYEFEGWYSDTALTQKVDLTTATFDEPTVLYANWTAAANTLTINLNGGQTTDDKTEIQVTLTTGQLTYLLYGTSITYEGHILVGYSTSQTGDAEYMDGASYTMGDEDKTLYAIWKADADTTTIDDGSTFSLRDVPAQAQEPSSEESEISIEETETTVDSESSESELEEETETTNPDNTETSVSENADTSQGSDIGATQDADVDAGAEVEIDTNADASTAANLELDTQSSE